MIEIVVRLLLLKKHLRCLIVRLTHLLVPFYRGIYIIAADSTIENPQLLIIPVQRLRIDAYARSTCAALDSGKLVFLIFLIYTLFF